MCCHLPCAPRSRIWALERVVPKEDKSASAWLAAGICVTALAAGVRALKRKRGSRPPPARSCTRRPDERPQPWSALCAGRAESPGTVRGQGPELLKVSPGPAVRAVVSGGLRRRGEEGEEGLAVLVAHLAVPLASRMPGPPLHLRQERLDHRPQFVFNMPWLRPSHPTPPDQRFRRDPTTSKIISLGVLRARGP